MNKKPLIVLVGPTAVGKTSISIDLASKLDGEIISADSMQIYKKMDIGTAKATHEEQKTIKHYLIDEVMPDQEFSVAQYKELADKYISEILDKEKLPIMVGGTGLYINSVINNIQFSETVTDWEYRNKLKALAEREGNAFIHKMLEDVDPVTSKKLHENDLRRVIRALEVHHFTGIPISKHQEESRREPSRYKTALIGLTMDRQWLYERINQRIDIMVEQGLVEEVEKLLESGYGKELTSMQGLGYKEIVAYLENTCSLEYAIEILKMNTRRYAKRQLTWFRRNPSIYWIEITKENKKEEVLEMCINHIAKIGII